MKNNNAKFETKTDLHEMWLGQIRDFYAKYRYIPTYEYMSETLRIGAKSTVKKLIDLLITERFIEHGPDNKLIPSQRFFEIPYSDESVQAGPFTDSAAQGGGHMSLLDVLIKKPSITRIRQVTGNSMMDLGILDGDWAVYEKRTDARVGDIVIALLEGSNEVTIKELGKEKNQYVLIPHNPKFEVIRPNKPFFIEGVLLSSFRTY